MLKRHYRLGMRGAVMVVLGVVTAGAVGCVSQGTHQRVVHENAALRAEREARAAEADRLHQRLADCCDSRRAGNNGHSGDCQWKGDAVRVPFGAKWTDVFGLDVKTTASLKTTFPDGGECVRVLDEAKTSDSWKIERSVSGETTVVPRVQVAD